MAKHTPGPWEAHATYDGRIDGYRIKSSIGDVAIACYLGGTELARTNARLIALAPTMLEELKRIHCCATVRRDGTCNGCSTSELIDKAEGRDVMTRGE
jgi:hypothetical protein